LKEQSYERPVDRPSEAVCRVCHGTIDSNGWFSPHSGKKIPPPKNLSYAQCNGCLSTGSIVYVYEVEDKPVLLPHCGDAKCEGYCQDPLCFPKEIVPVKKDVSIVKPNRTREFLFRIVIFLLGYLFAKFVMN
jgi:hypothetical protein